jgi:hypothetical protein
MQSAITYPDLGGPKLTDPMDPDPNSECWIHLIYLLLYIFLIISHHCLVHLNFIFTGTGYKVEVANPLFLYFRVVFLTMKKINIANLVLQCFKLNQSSRE